LAQRIEPRRMMIWFDIDISFRPQDHPDTELSDRNLSFVIKLPIGRYNVAKKLIDNRASLNLIMRKTFIEMSINLNDLTHIHDTFYGGHSRVVIHTHRTHRPGAVLWNRGQ
jgi:hypothetical protein